MPRPLSKTLGRRAATWTAFAVVAGFMAWGVFAQGPALIKASRFFHAWPLILAFLLCLGHRVVNARGWAFLLGALNCPIDPGLGSRIWLASESSRWLPGSVWSYGSRALIASRKGVPTELALASLVWELLLTVLAWTLVALAFAPWLGAGLSAQLAAVDFSSLWRRLSQPSVALPIVGLSVVALGMLLPIVMRRWEAVRVKGKLLNCVNVDARGMAGVLAFFTAMAFFNGVALLPIVRDLPGGAACPVAAVIAANAVAWIVGFLTPVAPGGLVVREACLASLLAPWLSFESALAVALAWRLAQIAAEVVTFLGVTAMGLDSSTDLRVRTGPPPAPAEVCAT